MNNKVNSKFVKIILDSEVNEAARGGICLCQTDVFNEFFVAFTLNDQANNKVSIYGLIFNSQGEKIKGEAKLIGQFKKLNNEHTHQLNPKCTNLSKQNKVLIVYESEEQDTNGFGIIQQTVKIEKNEIKVDNLEGSIINQGTNGNQIIGNILTLQNGKPFITFVSESDSKVYYQQLGELGQLENGNKSLQSTDIQNPGFYQLLQHPKDKGFLKLQIDKTSNEVYVTRYNESFAQLCQGKISYDQQFKDRLSQNALNFQKYTGFDFIWYQNMIYVILVEHIQFEVPSGQEKIFRVVGVNVSADQCQQQGGVVKELAKINDNNTVYPSVSLSLSIDSQGNVGIIGDIFVSEGSSRYLNQLLVQVDKIENCIQLNRQVLQCNLCAEGFVPEAENLDRSKCVAKKSNLGKDGEDGGKQEELPQYPKTIGELKANKKKKIKNLTLCDDHYHQSGQLCGDSLIGLIVLFRMIRNKKLLIEKLEQQRQLRVKMLGIRKKRRVHSMLPLQQKAQLRPRKNNEFYMGSSAQPPRLTQKEDETLNSSNNQSCNNQNQSFMGSSAQPYSSQIKKENFLKKKKEGEDRVTQIQLFKNYAQQLQKRDYKYSLHQRRDTLVQLKFSQQLLELGNGGDAGGEKSKKNCVAEQLSIDSLNSISSGGSSSSDGEGDIPQEIKQSTELSSQEFEQYSEQINVEYVYTFVNTNRKKNLDVVIQK